MMTFGESWHLLYASSAKFLRNTVSASVVSGLMCLLWAATALGQQRPVQLKHAVSCAQCRIEMAKVAEIGSPTDRVLLAESVLTIAANSKQQFFAASFDRYQVVLFGPDGKFQRTLGQQGDGPGEFNGQIRRISVGTGDTLYVFHEPFLSVFSPQLQFVRRFRLPPAQGYAVMDKGQVLMGGQLRSPSRIGYPYHILNERGEIQKSFGYDGGTIGPNSPAPPALMLRPTPDGRAAWGGPGGPPPYRLVKWGVDGVKQDSVEFVDMPWLREPRITIPVRTMRTFRGNLDTLPPPPSHSIDLLGVDSGSLLWVVVRRPVSYDEKNGLGFALRIEVYDPASRSLLVSQPVERAPYLFDGTSLGFTSSTDSDGVVQHTIWRLSVRRGAQQ